MGIKLIVKDQKIDLPRGAVVPREGDVIAITLRGEKQERLYTVSLVEHIMDFNILSTGITNITLKEIGDSDGSDGNS